MDFHSKKFAFKDIRHILSDRSISTETKRNFALRMKPTPVEEVHVFLKDTPLDSFIWETVEPNLIWTPPEKHPRIQESIDILHYIHYQNQNRRFDNHYLTAYAVHHMQEVLFQEIKGFLADTEISEEIRQKVIEKIPTVSYYEIRKFIENEEIEIDIRCDLIMKMAPVDFSTIRSILLDEKKDPDIRRELANKIHAVDFSEIEPFLWRQPLGSLIARTVIDNMHPTSFQRVEKVLRQNTGNFAIKQEALIKRTLPTPFSELRNFLADNDIHEYTRIQVARLATDLTNEDIFSFIEDYAIPADIRYEIAQKLRFSPSDTEKLFADIEKKDFQAKKINRFQKNLISPESDETVPEKRTLVLYFREEQ